MLEKVGFITLWCSCVFLCPFLGLPASLVMEVCRLSAICVKNAGSFGSAG